MTLEGTLHTVNYQRLSPFDWERFIDETYDELNDAHSECDLDWFYMNLRGLNSLDHAYQ